MLTDVQLQRARALARQCLLSGDRVTLGLTVTIEDGIPSFAVPSQSEPGAVHTLVYGLDGSLTCSCAAGRHQLPCCHLGLCLLFGWKHFVPQMARALNQAMEVLRACNF